MSIVKIVVVIIAVFIVVILVLAATKPDSFRVERSVAINAPPEAAFALVNDFHQWSVWSPFEDLDPEMERTYSGAERGEGAVYEWDGNRQAGKGRMEIQESTPPSRILIQLDFTAPFESNNISEFTFQPDGESTNVTWAMHGPNKFVGKVMSVFLSMDSMIGSDFERGLEKLRVTAEEKAKKTVGSEYTPR